MATPSTGSIVGAQKLRKVIFLLEEEYAFGKGDKAAWKKVFKRSVLPKYEAFLKKAAKERAREVSKRMSKSVFIGKGGAGRGTLARSIRVRGEPSKYAKIFEYGGTIRPKNHQYLTVPVGVNRKADGSKKKRNTDLPEYRTFTIVPKKTGIKTVFYKQGGRKTTSRTGKTYIKNPSRIQPYFHLVEQVEILPRRWASKAIQDARAKIHPYIRQSMDKFFSKRRR